MTSFLSMYTPLGRLNCAHWSMKVPSWSKIWMRLLPRSPRNNRPRESMASVCGPSISPGPLPFLPQVLMNFPVLSNFTTGSKFEPSQPNCTPGLTCEGGAKAPQRSATQMLLPSGSTSMPAVEPQLRPSGNLPNGAPTYGLGSELVGATAWE